MSVVATIVNIDGVAAQTWVGGHPGTGPRQHLHVAVLDRRNSARGVSPVWISSIEIGGDVSLSQMTEEEKHHLAVCLAQERFPDAKRFEQVAGFYKTNGFDFAKQEPEIQGAVIALLMNGEF